MAKSKWYKRKPAPRLRKVSSVPPSRFHVSGAKGWEVRVRLYPIRKGRR